MKIKYEFADGTVSEVEVSTEIGSVIIEFRKAEHAADERRRCHCPYSIDALTYEGTKTEAAESSGGCFLRDRQPQYAFRRFRIDAILPGDLRPGRICEKE